MALSTTMLQADMDFMIADLPTALTWNGATYNCIVADIDATDDLEMAGIVDGAEFQVVISKAAFLNGFPAEGARVTIGGVNYRVGSISDAPDGITRTLNCVGDTQ